jgi:hypothetical protein
MAATALGGCAGAMDMFSSDLLSKDAEWFSRPGRLFIKNVAIDAPPLTPDKAVGAEDLITADGACPGMAAPENATALSDTGAQPGEIRTGTVALGHTECDVTRGIGAPESVNISANERGERMTVLTWTRGARAGIYTFNGGRLSSIERAPQAVPEPKPARAKAAKKRVAG